VRHEADELLRLRPEIERRSHVFSAEKTGEAVPSSRMRDGATRGAGKPGHWLKINRVILLMSLNKKIFSWLWIKGEKSVNDRLVSYREEIFKGISGLVLEIGPGTGANFPFLPHGIEYVGVEPNENFHTILKEKLEYASFKSAKIISSVAEDLPFPDSTFDVVIVTQVLCSVPDQVKSLQEIKRVLKPGGKFIFIEHVKFKSWKKLFQYIEKPFSKIIGGGCDSTRDTEKELTKVGFSAISFKEDVVGVWMKVPYVYGCAVK
jgi:ubiquinone/menaquinone biosynthesis C-methylase UbiE